jgi:transposase
MPINVTIDADELKALLAIREEHAALRLESDKLRSTLRLVSAERDLAEERLRAYRRELFGAKSEVRTSDQLGLFNGSRPACDAPRHCSSRTSLVSQPCRST